MSAQRLTPTCRELELEVTAFVAGHLDARASAALAAHAQACGACGVTVRRERSLQAFLGGLPQAPERTLVAPRIPAGPAGRLVRLRFAWGAASAAAALLAAWWVLPESPRTGGSATGAETSALRVVDTGDVIPAWDDDLLRLVAGAEAVASRRVAEGR